MANSEYRIGVAFEADTAAGEKAADTVKKIGDNADAADSALKRAGQSQESVGKSLRETATAGTTAASALGKASQGVKSVMDGLEAAGGNFREIKGVLKEVGEQADTTGGKISGFGGLLGRLGPIAAAAMAGWKIGTWMREHREKFSEEAQQLKARAEAISAELKAVGERKIKFEGLNAGVMSSIETIDRLLGKIEALNAAEQRRMASETNAAVAGISERAVSATARAGSEEERAAIKARADQEIAAAKAAQELAKIQSDLKIEEEKYRQTVAKKELASWVLAKAEKDTAEALENYKNLVARKTAAGQSEEELKKDNEVIAARRGVTAGTDAVNRAVERTSKVDEQASQDLEILSQNIAALTADLRAAQANARAQQIELGGQSVTALRGLEQAIRDAQQRAATANAGVAAASQSGVGLAGALTAQSAANAELERLQTLQREAADRIKNGAQAVGAAFAEGASAMQQTSAKAAKDVGASAEVVKAATSSATSEIAGSVTKLGAAVTGGFKQVGDQVTNIASSVATSMSAVQARLAAVEAQAKQANATAGMALQQIQNGR